MFSKEKQLRVFNLSLQYMAIFNPICLCPNSTICIDVRQLQGTNLAVELFSFFLFAARFTKLKDAITQSIIENIPLNDTETYIKH